MQKIFLIIGLLSGAQAFGQEAVPGEYVVKFKVVETSQGRGFFAPKKHAISKLLSLKNAIGLVKVKENQVAALGQDPNIEYIEPNYIYRQLANIDVSKEYKDLWGMQKIQALDAWNNAGAGSKGIYVAVIDTGIDHKHPDLKENIIVKGYNAITRKEDGMDDQGHGTHCAGTIGAVANETGVIGVSPQVGLIPVKFLSKEGSGTLADAILAIDYALEKGARVLSNSWGGGPKSEALEAAIKTVCDAGAVFVAAAGNGGSDGRGDNNEITPSYPASYKLPCIISVAATDEEDRLTSFSNYGKNVHIAAPGYKILSTIPGNKYAVFSGTSMATPHVSGAIALALSVKPTLNAEEIKDALQSSADPVLDTSRDSFWKRIFNRGKPLGGGRLNLKKFIEEIR